MNRREKARQHKRKERERRLRQQRHAAQAHPDSAEAFEPEFEPEPLDAPAEDTPDDTPADAAPALTPLLAPFESERRQRRIARALAARAFPDAASRERAAAELAAQTPNALDAAFGPDPIEAAHDLALIAWDTEDPEEADGYLDEALELDPACVHARTLDALIENRGDRLITALAGIVEDAARALGGELFLARVKGRIWDEVRAWPYLTARNTLVEALIEAGRADEAIVHGEALLELDPDDHLNVRNHVCGALLERDELARARALLDRYAAVGGLGLAWGLILERFLSGARREAAALHRPTRRVLPEVEDLILGTARPVAPRDPAATVIEKLAADIHAPMARAWARHREARRWLADGAERSRWMVRVRSMCP